MCAPRWKPVHPGGVDNRRSSMARRRGKGRRRPSFGGGQPDVRKLAQELQAEMLKTQEALGEETVKATAGGGVVTVVMTGHQKLRSVKIAPEVLDPDDVEMLEDLIVAAVNEAVERSQQLATERMGRLTGGLGIPGLL